MALRFNGYSPVGATPWSAQCSTPIGNVSGSLSANANLRTLYGRGDRMNQRYAFGQLASTPNATEPPTTWIMAEKGGDLAAENTINEGNTVTANLQKGINMQASMTQDASITAAALSMITSMTANMVNANTLTGPMQMTLNLAANMAQAGQINASLGLIAWCSANMNQAADMSASNLRGTLSMAANIVSYSEFTAEGVRDAVWNAVLANYPNAGSAGLALATASSGGVDYSALAAAVWAAATRTLTAGAVPADIADAVRTELAVELAKVMTLPTATEIWADGKALTVGKFLGLK